MAGTSGSPPKAPTNLARWISERDQLYHQIMKHGWNAERGAFTQHDKTEVLDASLLMMPLTGFVVPSDPMWLSTLDAMDQELVSDSLVYRYNPSASPDGLLGNFPQAFTHLSLINAAIELDHRLDHGTGQDPVRHAGGAARS